MPIPKGVDSVSLQNELEVIRHGRKVVQHDRDAAVATANEVEVKRGRLQTKIEGLRAVVDRGKTRLTALETEILSAEQIKHFIEVSAKADELAKLKEDHAGVLGAIRNANAQIGKLQGISEHGATCPVCDQNIDAGKIAGLIADLEKESAEADARIQLIDTKIEAIGDIGCLLYTSRCV